MPASGDTVASSDVNLAQQRNAGPSTLGTADLAANAYATEITVETITVPVVAGRKYRIAYTIHFLTAAIGPSNVMYVRIKDGGGGQLTYVQHSWAAAPTFIDTRYLFTEWTAPSTGNQTFTATVQRLSGTQTVTLKGSAGQPRVLSVEWLGVNA